MPDPTTRDRMVTTAMQLFRREGYPATSWRRLIEAAGTPWGSAYHHFPGGKEELGVAAIELGSQIVQKTVRRAFEKHERTEDAIRWWFGKAAQSLAEDDYRGGCPLATITLEMAHASDKLTEAARQAFASWHELLVKNLQSHEDPEDLAIAIMNNLEGALLLSRIHRSPDALNRAAEHVVAIIQR
ncbi:TetR/AcrR family transcriptional regulator [Amycolatopsis sp. NPDC059657]|uniref:TetR/AcrR family transcriptional regulator n=1 Tax=Amycolatopsis sp. NPDC059657 TaxID=3346899 RepID=UPI00366AFD25